MQGSNEKRFDPIGEEDAELKEDLPPVVDTSSPLEHDILRDDGQPPILYTGKELGFRPQADNSTVCGAGGR